MSAHCRGVGLHDPQRSLSAQTVLLFCVGAPLGTSSQAGCAASSAAPAVLLLCYLWPQWDRQLPSTSPSPGAAFPSSPRPLPQLPPGIHVCDFLSHGNPHGIGYWDLCASTSLPGICRGNWWHLQFDVCIAPGTWGTPQQGPSNAQQRAQELTKSSLVPQATGRGQHVSAGTIKVNVSVTCSNRLTKPEGAGTSQQPSLSAAVASKNPGDIRKELEMKQVWWGWWAFSQDKPVPWSRSRTPTEHSKPTAAPDSLKLPMFCSLLSCSVRNPHFVFRNRNKLLSFR